uniref:Major facilitator superfamily (MFS) profile domain-containing protein n=1 Tax=Ditylenchus dipsaci TaxID=166011 RepID=A0A915DSD3_9BILA
MAIVWGLSAMPMMVSAFLVNDACVPSLNNSSLKCASQNGSLAQEFGLTGHKAVMVEYTTSAFLFGVVIGSTFLPFLSDKKGRRLVLLSSMTVIGLTGCGSAFASGIYSFIVLRFMQGIFFTGCSVTIGSWHMKVFL